MARPASLPVLSLEQMPEVASEQEAADFLRISKLALQEKAKAGQIGYIREGRSRTYPRTAIAEYIEAQTVRGFAEQAPATLNPGVAPGHGRVKRARRVAV
jgi:excisionase family DNA binding protein